MVPLPVPVRSRVVINQAPAVGQLESVTQEFERFGVLLADRQRARVLVFHFGELVDRSELLDDRSHFDDVRGHLDRGDVGTRTDAVAAAHLRRAAEAAFQMFQVEPFEHLTIGAPDPVARSLESSLHPYLRQRLCGRIQTTVGAGTGEIRNAALDVEREVERQREATAVERLRNSIASRQPRRGRPGEHAAGALRAPRRPAAGVGRLQRGRLELRGLRSPRPRRAGPARPVAASSKPVDDIVELAIEAALAQSCHVEICVDNPDLDVMGRIGALLRY